MVSPHPEWEDTQRGYENGRWKVLVYEFEGVWRVDTDGSTLPLPPEGPLLTTPDARKAWEIANILTWVISYEGLDVFLGNIEQDAPGYSKPNWSPWTRVPRDVDAREAVANLLGAYRFQLEPALNGEEPPQPGDER